MDSRVLFVVMMALPSLAACSGRQVPPTAPPDAPLATGPTVGPPAEPACVLLEVTFVANAGFVLAAGEDKVIVDALFGDSYPGFPTLSAAQHDALAKGLPPFDGIDVVFATHHHADHFDAQRVAEYLTRNREVHFVSTQAAVDLVTKASPDGRGFGDRAHGYAYERGASTVVWPRKGRRRSWPTRYNPPPSSQCTSRQRRPARPRRLNSTGNARRCSNGWRTSCR